MPAAMPSTPQATPPAAPSARRLQLKASRLVTAIFAGEYRSSFRGRGIEFDEVREYQPGDDIRSIDWNVTARQGRPFIKRFIEERELTLIILLDRSLTMEFGTVRCTKLDAAAETAALLAFAALRSHDRIGLLTFGDGPVRFLPPAKGKRQTLRLIAEAVTPLSRDNAGSSLTDALVYLEQLLKGRALVCILSDFCAPLPFRFLAALAARHDVAAAAVSDPAENELPPAGLLRFKDPDGGNVLLADCDSPEVRRDFRLAAAGRRAAVKERLTAAGAGYLEIGTQESPLHPLIGFFRSRGRRRSP